jgi:hypothetical protein
MSTLTIWMLILTATTLFWVVAFGLLKFITSL